MERLRTGRRSRTVRLRRVRHYSPLAAGSKRIDALKRGRPNLVEIDVGGEYPYEAVLLSGRMLFAIA